MKFDIFVAYIKAVRPIAFVLISISYVLYIGFQVYNSYWLSLWSEDVSAYNDTAKRDTYLGIYGALGACQGKILVREDRVFQIDSRFSVEYSSMDE